jgi:hypothetical protein
MALRRARSTHSVPPPPQGKNFGIHVPATKASWRWAFYSCNGLDGTKDVPAAKGILPLWKDVVAQHTQQPLHLLVGGGDQLYRDAVFRGPLLSGWDKTTSDVSSRGRRRCWGALHAWPSTACVLRQLMRPPHCTPQLMHMHVARAVPSPERPGSLRSQEATEDKLELPLTDAIKSEIEVGLGGSGRRRLSYHGLL